MDDDFEERLRRAGRRRRAILIAVGAAAALGLAALFASAHRGGDDVRLAPEVKLSPAQQGELDAAIARSRARIAQLDAPWRAQIVALDPRTVAADAPVCDALAWARDSLAGNPQGSEWGSWAVPPPLGFNASSTASFSHAPFPMTFFAAGADVPARSPEASAYLAQLDDLAHGGWSTMSFEDRRARATVDALRTADVLVRLDEVVEPRLAERDRFEPGSIVASVWVFDHAHGAITCAGVVRVASSTTVDPGSSNLDDDLVINLVRAIPDGVRRVASPRSP